MQIVRSIWVFKELVDAACGEIGRWRRKGFITMMRQALVSVAAAAFVVLSGAGQADKGVLRRVRSGVMEVGMPPLWGVGATLLTAGPRAGTQCGGGTGAPTGHGKRLSLHTAVERQDWPNARGPCVCVSFEAVCVYRTKAKWPDVSNVWERDLVA